MPPPVLVRVRYLKDLGGLPRSGRDARQHRQFTDGLVRYLQREGSGWLFVGALPGAMARTRSVVLEGELSRTETGPAGGAYLCVVRLRDEHTGRMLAQWAGTADNFRFLYGNLTSAEGISAQGLLGELGERVMAFLQRAGRAPEGDTRPVRVLSTEGNPFPDKEL